MNLIVPTQHSQVEGLTSLLTECGEWASMDIIKANSGHKGGALVQQEW